MDVSHILLPDFEEVLRDHPEQAREIFAELHPADTAELLAQMTPEIQATAIPYIPEDQVGEVIDFLGPGRRSPVFRLLSLDVQVRVAQAMSADDRADMFTNLEPSIVDAVLAKLPKDEALDVRELMTWPKNTAGGLMTTDIASVHADLTVGEVLDQVRHFAEEMETVSYVYLTDRGTGKLMGVLSLRELVLNKPSRPAAEVMNDKVVTVAPQMDQEEVARIIHKYDYIALPVADEHGKLLGIVTVDDMVDVVVQEGTEDIQRMGGIEAFETPYFNTPFPKLFRARATWLVVIFVGEMFTGTAMQHYDSVLESVRPLVWFIPLIISSGGNSGSQTATLIVRGLAVGEIQMKSAGKVLARELKMGLSLGLLLGTIGFFRVLLTAAEPKFAIASVVAIALLGVVTFGCMTATVMPFLLKRLGLDPAVSSAPFIASLVDVTGIVIYVKVAMLLLDVVVP